MVWDLGLGVRNSVSRPIERETVRILTREDFKIHEEMKKIEDEYSMVMKNKNRVWLV
jgi:hypothetical protein